MFLDATGEQRTCTIVRDITARAAADRALRDRTTELAHALDRIIEQTEATRRAAIEINDDIVQGLVAAETALDLDRNDEARQFVGRTSRAARDWISHQLRVGGPPTPGSLKRQHPDTSPGSAADQ